MGIGCQGYIFPKIDMQQITKMFLHAHKLIWNKQKHAVAAMPPNSQTINDMLILNKMFWSSKQSLHLAKSTFSLPLKVIPSSFNTFPVPDQEFVKAILILRNRNLLQGAMHCHLHILKALKSVSANL